MQKVHIAIRDGKRTVLTARSFD